MSDNSAIEWTDATWTPIRGDPTRDPKQRWYCQRISPGCDHCYASTLAHRFGGRAYPAVGSENGLDHVRLDEVALYAPTGWRKPRRVFLSSMTDVAGEWVPVEWFHALMTVMAETPQHTYQVLTKRPRRLKELVEHFYADAPGCGVPLPNVWLGTSIESDAYTWRAKVLAEIPAVVRFVSAEPLLGPLPSLPLPEQLIACISCGTEQRFASATCYQCRGRIYEPDRHRWVKPAAIDWLIVGGESGGPAERRLVVKNTTCAFAAPALAAGGHSGCWEPKPEALVWVRDLRDRAKAAGVMFHFKQFGGPTHAAGGRMLDGRTWDEYPEPRAAALA